MKFVVLFVFFGILIRFFLASHAYPTLVFDTKTYVDFAQEFLQGHIPIDPRTKNMGYPLFLAVLFWLRSGVVDISFVKFVQIVLDLFAGIFVFIAAKKVFSLPTARVALGLYMLNPFTSSYVGLMLPEAYSCFLVGLLLVITTRADFAKNSTAWFFVGLTTGLLLFARFSLLVFAIGSFGMISLFCFKRNLVWKFVIMSLAGFLIASSYTLIVNYKTYGRPSFTPPYTTVGGQIYLTMFYADRYPEVEFWGVNPEETRVYEEYRQTPLSGLSGWNKRYMNLFYAKLLSEPSTFVSHYMKNIFWLWDKDHLFTYEDPWYPADRYVLRVANLLLLGLGVFGIIHYLNGGLRMLREPYSIVTLVMAAVMTLQFPLVSNENRHTIPFYPLLFFWAAYGFDRVGRMIKSRI